MKEMQDNNLFGDDDDDGTPNASMPEIKEFSLKDITQTVDLTQLRRQNMEENVAHFGRGHDAEDFWTSPSPTKHKKENCKPIPTVEPPEEKPSLSPQSETCSNFLARSAALLDCSPDMPPGELLLPEKPVSNVACEYKVIKETPMIRKNTVTSFSASEPTLESIAETDVSVHEDHVYDVIDRKESQNDISDNSATFLPTIPNGGINNKQTNLDSSEYYTHRIYSNDFAELTDDDKAPLSRQLSMPSKQKDSRTYHPRKRQTIHGNRRKNDNKSFNLEKFSKEELLLMWKSSELELSEKLDAAKKDKERLRSKLSALKLQMSTPV